MAFRVKEGCPARKPKLYAHLRLAKAKHENLDANS